MNKSSRKLYQYPEGRIFRVAKGTRKESSMCFVSGLIDFMKFVAVNEERKLTAVAGKSRTTRGIRRGNWPGLHIFARNSRMLRLEIDIASSRCTRASVIINHRRRKLLVTTPLVKRSVRSRIERYRPTLDRPVAANLRDFLFKRFRFRV